MGITNSNKQIDVDQISCDGTLRVTLALSAAPDIAANPTDIVLVLDRSGSMAGSPLTNMKAGADTFIDINRHRLREPHRCGQLLGYGNSGNPTDYLRGNAEGSGKRIDGGWVHQSCRRLYQSDAAV